LIFYTPTFVKRYEKLPGALKVEVKHKIQEFRNPENHISLKVRTPAGRLKKPIPFQ